MRRVIGPLSIVVLLAGLGTANTAHAQAYPSRPIQLLVPFSAGNVIDLLARGLAEGLGPAIGGSIQVVNREGAAGIVMMSALAASKPDGYTLGFAPQGQLTIQPHLKADLPYKPDSITPICQTFENQFAIVVGPDSPHKDFKGLIAFAKQNPGKLTWGDSGLSTVPNLQMYSLLQSAGIKMEYTPYRSYPQLIQDVLAGRLDLAAPSIGSFNGQPLRVLAILADKRHPMYANAPTVAEFGYSVSMPGFGGLYAPAGLPADVLAKLDAGCPAAVASASYKSIAERTGAPTPYLDGAGFQRRLQDDSKAKGELIKALNIKVE
jgi:tripartite-type tricarboxylate transporter receptor subunit TctC